MPISDQRRSELEREKESLQARIAAIDKELGLSNPRIAELVQQIKSGSENAGSNLKELYGLIGSKEGRQETKKLEMFPKLFEYMNHDNRSVRYWNSAVIVRALWNDEIKKQFYGKNGFFYLLKGLKKEIKEKDSGIKNNYLVSLGNLMCLDEATEQCYALGGVKLLMDIVGNVSDEKSQPKPDERAIAQALFCLSNICTKVEKARNDIYDSAGYEIIAPFLVSKNANCVKWSTSLIQRLVSMNEATRKAIGRKADIVDDLLGMIQNTGLDWNTRCCVVSTISWLISCPSVKEKCVREQLGVELQLIKDAIPRDMHDYAYHTGRLDALFRECKI